MEKENKGISVVLVVFIFIVFIGVIGIGGYLLYNNNTKIAELENKIATQKEENTTNKTTNNVTSEEEFVVPSLETAKAKNPINNVEYRLTSEETRIFSFEIIDGIVYISTGFDNLNQYAEALNVDNPNIELGKRYEVTGFSKKVVECEEGLFGQQLSGTCLLFLMEDGTIEYATLEHLLKETTTQGKIQGIKNIVKIQSVNVVDLDENGEGMGGSLSVVAIDKDNYYYDLSNYIEEDTQETVQE